MALKRVKIKSSKLIVAKKYIMELPDGRFRWFQTGNQDGWYTISDKFPEPDDTPHTETLNFDQDEYMLNWLLRLEEGYGNIVMAHCRSIYSLVHTIQENNPVTPIQEDWDLIMELAGFYEPEDVNKVAQIFGFIYYGMIAEENKEKAPCGKKLKLLGIYQVLVEGLNPKDAACYSKNDSTSILLGTPSDKKYVRLLAECKIRGIL